MKQPGTALGLRVAIALICTALPTSGCLLTVARAVSVQGSETKYSQLKPSLAQVKQGQARLFVYAPSAGWGTAAVVGPSGLVLDVPCTIDEAVFRLNGAAYFYADVPEGSHVVGVARRVDRSSGRPEHGDKSVEVTLKSGEEGYVMIEYPTYAPILKDREMAEKELADLPLTSGM
jgi:hypothetical protein